MRLLLAIDIHDHPSDLLEQAIGWATSVRGTLDLLYVDEYRYNTYLVSDPAVQAVLDDQWDKIQADNEARLAELVQTLPEGVRGRGVYQVGRAHVQVVDACADYDAVLIGTHGRTGLEHALVGSVAERVIRRATRPVLVLRCADAASD